MNLCPCLSHFLTPSLKLGSKAETDNSSEQQPPPPSYSSFQNDSEILRERVTPNPSPAQRDEALPFFLASCSKPSRTQTGYDNHYTVKIACSPHYESIKTVYTRFESITRPPFENWTSEEMEDSARRLYQQQMPLNPHFTLLIYKLLKNNGSALCLNSRVSYPAKYRVFVTHEKIKRVLSTLNPLNSSLEKEESSLTPPLFIAREGEEIRGGRKGGARELSGKYSTSIELEIYSEREASLIFKNKENFICRGTYKKVWKVFTLNSTEMKAMAISIRHLNQEEAGRAPSQSKAAAYHIQANREEYCFKTFSNESWIGQVDRIFYTRDISDPLTRQQQVMEMKFYPKTLFDIVSAGLEAPTPTENKINYSIDCIKGIAGLHGQGLIYRDLKPENVLVDARGAYLTDFGVCMPASDPDFFHRHGTFFYYAPELLLDNKDHYGPPLDIWSLGSVLWMLWFSDIHPWYELLDDIENKKNKQPFDSNHPLIKTIEEYSRLTTEELIEVHGEKNLQLRILIQKMLKPSPQDRPTALEVLGEFSQFQSDLI